MEDSEQLRVVSGSHSANLSKSDLRAIGVALQQAIEDPEKLNKSGAPKEIIALLHGSFSEPRYSENNLSVRAGEWLLVVDEESLFWQNRIAPPKPPQIGLMFIARLLHSKAGWTVPRLSFQRIH
jgi:hypothetical protein